MFESDLNEARKKALGLYKILPRNIKEEFKGFFEDEEYTIPNNKEWYLGAESAAISSIFSTCFEEKEESGIILLGLLGYVLEKAEEYNCPVNAIFNSKSKKMRKIAREAYDFYLGSRDKKEFEKIENEFFSPTSTFSRTKNGFEGAAYCLEKAIEILMLVKDDMKEEVFSGIRFHTTVFLVCEGYYVFKLEKLGAKLDEMY